MTVFIPKTGQSNRKRAKSAYLAATLNFVIMGLGYLYLGEKRRFGALLVSSQVIAALSIVFWNYAVLAPLSYDIVSGLGRLAIGMAFALDAYEMSSRNGKA